MKSINITSFCKLILIGFFQGVNEKDISRDHSFMYHDNLSVARGLPIHNIRKTMKETYDKVVKKIILNIVKTNNILIITYFQSLRIYE